MFEPVEVEWLDSTRFSETWYSLEEALNKKIAVARTIGYLLTETNHSLLICQSYGTEEDEQEVGGLFAIPKSSVSKLRFLDEG